MPPWEDGQQTLKAALEEITARSDKAGVERAVTWRQIADALERSRVREAQMCSARTFAKNWRPFLDVAVRLIERGQAQDGYTLLKGGLEEWKDAPGHEG